MASQLLLEIKGASGCQVMHYGGTEWVLSYRKHAVSFKSTSAALISLTQTPQYNLSGS